MRVISSQHEDATYQIASQFHKKDLLSTFHVLYTRHATIPPKATPSRNGDHAKPEDAIALGFVSATKKSLCNLL